MSFGCCSSQEQALSKNTTRSVPFHRNNPGIGTALFDHAGAMWTHEYKGSDPFFQAYRYSDYAA